MSHRRLGRTGMPMGPLALGTMMFGAFGEPDHDICTQIIHRALDAGITLIDTADSYSQGESEEIIGKALKGRRDDVIVATKVSTQMGAGRYQGPSPLKRGGSRRWIMQEVEASLRRLQTDHIDLYQLHREDHETNIDETLSALTDLQRQGKIRAFGSSTFPAHRIVQAQWVSEKHGLGRFVTEQPTYSLLNRSIEVDVLPVTQEFDMGVLVWSPLSAGWLTGRYRKGGDSPLRSAAQGTLPSNDFNNPANAPKLEAVEKLAQLADAEGISLIHLALAFVVQHPAVTAALIGPRTVAHLDSQLGAADITLSSDILDRIDEIVRPGTALPIADNFAQPPALSDPHLRRRRTD